MKLYYHKSYLGPNFGDDLNPWLWNKLIPKFFNSEADDIFIGIGTLINDQLKNKIDDSKQKIVFGTGVGYGRGGIPEIDNSWNIYCLRGPLSARALNVSEQKAITDGALLVKNVYSVNSPKIYKYSFIPHIKSAVSGSEQWKKICNNNNIFYIDPRNNVDYVLKSINKSEIVLTEAMHGAIIADALRVPWIPIQTSKNILKFKWQDWCLSLNLEYNPTHTLLLYDSKNNSSYFDKKKKEIKLKIVESQIKSIIKNKTPVLSEHKILNNRYEQLNEQLNRLKLDLTSESI